MDLKELSSVLSKYLFITNKLGSTVCDIGCGKGVGAYLLAPFHVEVLGLDPIQENIWWAKNRLKNENLSYSQCDYWKVHMFGKFDAVILFDTGKKELDDETLSNYLIYLFNKTLEKGGKLLFDYNESNEAKLKNLFLAQTPVIYKEQRVIEVTFDFYNRLKNIHL